MSLRGNLAAFLALLVIFQIPTVHLVFLANTPQEAAANEGILLEKVTLQATDIESATETSELQAQDKCNTLQSLLREGRNYTSHPVTAQEDALLSECDSSGITAAICHPTLFGNEIQLGRLFAFVSYYRLLGFDHVFFWYTPDIALQQHFLQLQSLPYVTMTEYRGGEEGYYGQREVMRACLNQPEYAAGYDWALSIDADEYLWFREPMGIKEFLSKPKYQNYNYFSFGKWTYTQMHAIDIKQDSGFDLDRYAFTGRSFCRGHYGETYCPTYKGRCKILAKPTIYPYPSFQLHGLLDNLNATDAIHLDTLEAHLKEWRTVLIWNKISKIREPANFAVSSDAEVNVHKNLMISHKLVNDKVIFHFDDHLKDWSRFVASGCNRLLFTSSGVSWVAPVHN